MERMLILCKGRDCVCMLLRFVLKSLLLLVKNLLLSVDFFFYFNTKPMLYHCIPSSYFPLVCVFVSVKLAGQNIISVKAE